MEKRRILELLELQYSDLILLSSDDYMMSISSSSRDEIERLEALTGAIMENLGPEGPGLLTITGVPSASNLRSSLLPLARDLALLDNDDRKRILKEHGLGSDVSLKNLNRCVSSFATQLKYQHDVDNMVEAHLGVDRLSIAIEDKFKNLGYYFRELGFCMMHLGLSLARICDRVIGGHELEQSLLESHAAKGRLIHYHSAHDTLFIKESARRKGSTKGHANSRSPHNGSTSEEFPNRSLVSKDGNGVRSSEKHPDLWQQWHYDYGIFTVLTSPMFLSPCSCQTVYFRDCCQSCLNQDCSSPAGHSYLQILHPNLNGICTVKTPPDCFIVQVGESADVLSRGKLRSTLHSVCRPPEPENLSRETFVVFLQPAWNKVFDISDYPVSETSGKEPEADQLELTNLNQEIYNVVPPLFSRLRNGMTFAEFSHETTKRYYGSRGLQSNR